MKILTVGLGYIGLPTAVTFATNGQQVVGVDVQKDVVQKLNQGQVHIEEYGIRDALQEALAQKHFRAQTSMEPADVFIIAVPTPNRTDFYKSCDLTYVVNAVENILPHLQTGNTVIIESTISPRTTVDVIQPMIESAGFTVGKDIFLVHCPERVLPGKILHELKYNNRIVGGVTPRCTEAGKKVYGIFVEGELIESTASEAELSKLVENTFRDVNIALANELIKVGEKLDINALKVIDMANKHPRVTIHSPGPGVGGHCLAVDPYFIIANAPEETPLIQTARTINNSMPELVVKKVNRLMTNIKGKKITVLGVTYKGNVDDIRESPAIKIIDQLSIENNYQISVYDPYVKAPWIADDFNNAVDQSDLLLVLTDHDEFKTIKMNQLKGMTQIYVFDTKNICSAEMRKNNYFNLGNLASV